MTAKYGSGRFCSRSCANKRAHSEETKNKIKNSLRDIYTNPNKKQQADSLRAKSRDAARKLCEKRGFTVITEEEYDHHPSYCIICGEKLDFSLRNRKTCSKDCYTENLRRLDVEREFGGFHMCKARILYDGVVLDSSYELILAKDLDANNIK